LDNLERKIIDKKMAKQNKVNRLRKHKIEFYVDDSELKTIKKREVRFQNRSHFLREVSLKAKIVLPPSALDKGAAVSLRRVGNNINQIARTLNESDFNLLDTAVRIDLINHINSMKELLNETITKINSITNVK